MILPIALAAGGAAVAFGALERYRKTSHGPNPWTTEALANVVRLAMHWEHAAKIIDGTITSVFRSVEVNRKAKGVSTSKHLRALAVDIKPAILSPKAAVDKLHSAAARGELGPVAKILEEPTIVHLEYLAAGEAPPKRITLGYWEPPKDRVAT